LRWGITPRDGRKFVGWLKFAPAQAESANHKVVVEQLFFHNTCDELSGGVDALHGQFIVRIGTKQIHR
jgi:hypothetical protein